MLKMKNFEGQLVPQCMQIHMQMIESNQQISPTGVTCEPNNKPTISGWYLKPINGAIGDGLWLGLPH